MHSMHMLTARRCAAVAVVLAAGSGYAAAPASAEAGGRGSTATRWTVTNLVGGLNAPRGIALDGRGGVYVAQSGATGGGDFGLTQGSVTKYRWHHGALASAWSTPFTGIYASEDPTSPPDALGPAGLSVACTGKNHHHHRTQCDVYMIDSSNRNEVQALGGPAVPDIGHLFRLSGRTGASTDVSDFGDQSYQWTADHKDLWEEFPDANPYGVLVMDTHHGKRVFVADAGANTISEVAADGTARVISYIPNEADVGNGVRDATPTCIAQGPDHMLYVGTLDLGSNFENGGGQSIVWRVDPNSTDWAHNATIWARGFTTITSCTFDRHGHFWATEMFADNGPSAPPGDLAMTRFGDPTHAVTHVGAGQLPLPGGVAVARDGSIFVTTGSSAPNGGGGVAVVTRSHAS